MLGNQIRLQRLKKGYSQSYMAYCLEISQNAYSKIELDRTDLTLSRILAIANVLEVPVAHLLITILEEKASRELLPA
jgi:transcriptional regulator with XRE-family HTH domain